MFNECFTLNYIALVSKSKKTSSRPEVFFEKAVLKTSACNFTKMGLHHRCFPVNFPNLFGTAYLQNTYGFGWSLHTKRNEYGDSSKV